MGDVATNPIRGNDGSFFTLKLATDPAVELDGHVKKIELDNEDKDDLTFAEVQSGDTKNHTLKVTGIVDMSEGSLWRLLHDNPSGVFDAVYGPGGNAVPTATKPHIVGVVKADGKPKLSTEARTGRQREEFEYELAFDGDYDLDDGA